MNNPVDLFRPYYAHNATANLAKVLTPDALGRVHTGQGPLVDEFERQFAALVGAPDPDTVVSTNSCTSALDIALKLAGVEHGQGHEVIAPPLTCTATSGAIVNAGARIVWADVDPWTGCIEPGDVRRKLTERTKAVVAVNWAGRESDHHALLDSLTEHGFGRGRGRTPLIVDAAHGPHTFISADYICFSFGPIKQLTAGDGGALVIRSLDWAASVDRARKLRWHGLDRRSSADFRCGQQSITEPGTKAHLTDLNAAIGLANIQDARWVVGKHREHAAWYDRRLADYDGRGIALPPPDPGCSYWCYFLLVEDRDGFIAHMKARGIQCSPVHSRNDVGHPAYNFPNGPLPGVDYYAARHVAIPVGWWLSDVDLDRVATGVRDWAEMRKGGRDRAGVSGPAGLAAAPLHGGHR